MVGQDLSVSATSPKIFLFFRGMNGGRGQSVLPRHSRRVQINVISLSLSPDLSYATEMRRTVFWEHSDVVPNRRANASSNAWTSTSWYLKRCHLCNKATGHFLKKTIWKYKKCSDD
uniref:Uncharacterized protein n=1 Tax=Rhipicephalus zambeziensis TaxID=60191 RepID=A0A224YHV1_9ACAR